MNFKELAGKKVGGIPVLYLAAAAVLVLAIYAWRLKPAAAFDEAEDTSQGPADTASSDEIADESAYGSLATNGTVTVVQPPVSTTPEPVEKTNEIWVKEGAEWAVTIAAKNKGVVTTGAQAVSALNKYVLGEDLSYEETSVVNAVIAEKGQPPDGVGTGGKISLDPPATRQGTPPLIHTVKGKNDATYQQLISLYYGSTSQPTFDLVQAANVDKLGFSGTYPPGTTVKIPAYTPPQFFTTTAATSTRKAICAKNGITEAQFEALNNYSYVNFKPGSKVRVK